MSYKIQGLYSLKKEGFGWEDICVELGVTDKSERLEIKRLFFKLATRRPS